MTRTEFEQNFETLRLAKARLESLVLADILDVEALISAHAIFSAARAADLAYRRAQDQARQEQETRLREARERHLTTLAGVGKAALLAELGGVGANWTTVNLREQVARFRAEAEIGE